LDLAPQKQMLLLRVQSDNIYHETKFSHTLFRCLALRPPVAKQLTA